MDERQPSDEELVARFLNGSAEGFITLVERYETKVFNTALNLTNDLEAAEEVLGEVFAALFERIRSDFGKTPLFTWLIQYTLDCALAHLIERGRRDGETQVVVLDQPYSVHEARFEEKHRTLRSALRTALGTLNDDLRYVFVLGDIQGLSLKQVAEMLDITIFEARACLHRARLILKRELEKLLSLTPNPLPLTHVR